MHRTITHRFAFSVLAAVVLLGTWMLFAFLAGASIEMLASAVDHAGEAFGRLL